MKETIVWFQDGVKLKSSPSKWEEIDVLTNQLINLIGHPDFTHRVVDPTQAKGRLHLESSDCPSVCFDLTGTRVGAELFPDILQIQNFRLSRIRNITSPRLDGCGHIISLSSTERSTLLSAHDSSKPLILDDVVWSGRTALEAIRILGLPPANSMFAAFAINIGNFGEGRPGAAGLLEAQGIQLKWGETVSTPQDDGFHLSDFFDHPHITESEIFDVVIQIQQLRENILAEDGSRKKELDLEIKGLLEEHRQVLFPKSRSTEEIKRIQSDGKLIVNGGLPKNSFFDVNPLNWLMPSFSKRIRSEMMKIQKPKIL